MPEIELPIELSRIILDGAEETKLGDKKGAIRQYRKGNLHIREYESRFTVHSDRVDPRKDPLGHLLFDAQEVLVGLVGAAIGGGIVGKLIYNIKKDSSFKKQQSIIGGLTASLVTGYVSYYIAKKLKEIMDKLQTIQKKINFIAAEIREHKIELYRLHKELQEAINEQQELKE